MLRIKEWSTRKKIFLGTGLLVYILVLGLLGFILSGRTTAKEILTVLPTTSLLKDDVYPKVADIANPITGVLYTKEEAAIWKGRSPLGIMVENSIPARPQSSLNKADVVYEALAEGDITRFAGIFLSQGSEKIGPVRSAREYYLDWISEYGAAYAHWGGNEYVRALARSVFGSKDLDQFVVGGAAFYRVGSGEHSGFTDTGKLWNVLNGRGANTFPQIRSWAFKEDSSANPPAYSQINVNFSNANNYNVMWRYDASSNKYLRFNGGVSHTDRETGQQLSVKNVVVTFIDSLGYKQVTPGVSNRAFRTIGSGKAKIFLDGTIIEANWKKDGRAERTVYTDEKGKEIKLNRGQIWMEMVPSGSSVSYQ